MNQLYIYIYPLFSGFPSHLGHHRALHRVPCAIQQVQGRHFLMNNILQKSEEEEIFSNQFHEGIELSYIIMIKTLRKKEATVKSFTLDHAASQCLIPLCFPGS